ncbi:MAG TPA: urease accessory protein UreD [Kofleriaceae bacterium]|nr:urease accessory protein UreD [Kofleriaceae bacterium]
MAASASSLEIARVRNRSVVTSARSATPLRLLSPSGDGHAAWVYQSSLGGGFVGGDDVALRIDVTAGASLFLSSQASSKVYRGARSAFTLDVTVGEAATLVSWPDPVVCFAGAAFDQVQRFALEPTANLVAVDAWTAGRIARGERWTFERLSTRLALAIGGESVLHDATLVSGAHGELGTRFGELGAFATIVLAGPRLVEACDRLAARVATRALGWPLITASRWPWGLVIRVGAAAGEPLARASYDLLRSDVIGLLGADPWARKW